MNTDVNVSNSQQRRWLRRISIEQLETRRLLTAISFLPRTVEPSDAGLWDTVRVVDLDGDGDLDVVSGGTLAWYENSNGQFGRKSIIDETYARTVAAADLDDDGDQDLVASIDDGVYWYENVVTTDMFSEPRLMTQVSLQRITLADVDADGDMDILGATTGRSIVDIVWLENLGDLSFTSHVLGKTSVVTFTERSFSIGDTDGDGDLDVLAKLNDEPDGMTLVLFEKIEEGYLERQIVDLPGLRLDSALADVDGDGDLDAVLLSRENETFQTFWLENAAGVFGNRRLVGESQTWIGSGVQAVDIDGDLDIDIVAGNVWYENIDSASSFVEHDASGVSGLSGDIDNDGDVDLIAFGLPLLFQWYENTDGKGKFMPQTIASDAGGTLDLRISGKTTSVIDMLAWSDRKEIHDANLFNRSRRDDAEVL